MTPPLTSRPCTRDGCDRPRWGGKLCAHHGNELKLKAGRVLRRARSTLAPESEKRRAQRPARRAAETALGRVGTQGQCARCLTYGYVNGHERLGGSGRRDMTNPDCLLCIPCNGWCEDNPVLAAWQGWKLTHKHPRNPELAPDEARTTLGTVHRFTTSVVIG